MRGQVCLSIFNACPVPSIARALGYHLSLIVFERWQQCYASLSDPSLGCVAAMRARKRRTPDQQEQKRACTQRRKLTYVSWCVHASQLRKRGSGKHQTNKYTKGLACTPRWYTYVSASKQASALSTSASMSSHMRTYVCITRRCRLWGDKASARYVVPLF